MSAVSDRPRIAYVVTSPTTARVLLRGQLARMKAWGFDVTVISAPGSELDVVAEREGVPTVAVPMLREIAPADDARSLVDVIAAIRRVRPHIVNASTPKAGLLGMLAARALNVPIRIYLLRGLRLETSHGAQRAILGVTERIASACAGSIVCVSESLRRNYVAGGYAASDKTSVVGGGSSNGVDADRFESTAAMRARASEIRRDLMIPDDSLVIGFVGRLVSDKGIVELLSAFQSLRRTRTDARLLMLGADLAGDAVSSELGSRVRQSPGTVIVGQVTEPAPYYAAMDILAFPSFREGFPNVPLEAGAAGIPVVGFRATGVIDAVQDGRTGLLVDKGDVAGLASALQRYADDPVLRARHGAAGRERVRTSFDREAVWRAWAAEYARLLQARALPLPSGFHLDWHIDPP